MEEQKSNFEDQTSGVNDHLISLSSQQRFDRMEEQRKEDRENLYEVIKQVELLAASFQERHDIRQSPPSESELGRNFTTGTT